MAYTFPLTTADFMDVLPVSQILFDTPDAIEISRTEGGEVISADMGPMLWQGEIKLGVSTRDEAVDLEAMLDILRPAGRSFWCYDTRRPAPLADPLGIVLGTNVVTIAALPAGNREISLAGLPAWYRLTRGDYLAFDYGSPARRALHKVVSKVAQANAAGTIAAFEVTPLIRPGATLAAVVTLIKPCCKARLVPGTVSKGASFRTITRDAAFSFIQTLG
jgi:hypothetical protein